MPWEYAESALDVVKKLKSEGAYIVAAELAENAKPLGALKPPNWPVAVVLGREYDGLGEDILQMSDIVVELPIYGIAKSLNVSVVAGIVTDGTGGSCLRD